MSSSLPYLSPSKMAEYRQSLQLFAKGATHVECVRSHYYPDRTGLCDLTGARDQEEIFVLANRVGTTLKVSAQAMHIVANVVDITGADQWYQHLKDQKKNEKERREQEMQKREAQKNSSRVVLIRKSLQSVLGDNKNS